MPSAHESDSHLDTAEVPTIDRSALTATTFLEIVDPLVGEFDVIDVLTSLASRCVELLDVAAAGILLADETGRLRVIGASTEQVQLLELFQLQSDEGPCLDCYRTGLVVASERLDAESPWPVFAAESLRVGFPSVCAVPLRCTKWCWVASTCSCATRCRWAHSTWRWHEPSPTWPASPSCRTRPRARQQCARASCSTR